MIRLVTPAFIAMAAAALPVAAETASQFGCSSHEFSSLPSLEGKEGVFYRVQADLRLQHPMDDIIVSRLATLSRVLAEGGTTLVFVNVPTKGQAMPQYLPDHAADYGFEQVAADANYLDVVNRLNSAGVAAPDLMTAMRAAPDGERVFFGSDFHWTPAGARLAAQAIGALIRSLPAYADVTPLEFKTTEGPEETAFSGMRRELQTFCTLSLPEVRSATYHTERADAGVASAADIFAAAPAAATDTGALDIFGTGDAAASVVLIGTSFSDNSINNFAGFLAQYSGIEVTNYAITGGNQFGSITSYLTSKDFAERRPTFLVWENPIYNSLAQNGPIPMDELIAAAGGACDIPLGSKPEGASGLSATLDPARLKSGDALLFDFGAEGSRRVTITLTAASGITRTVQIDRGERLRATGRFFLRLTPYWQPDLTGVTAEFDRPLSQGAAITLCPPVKGDAS